MNRKMGWVLWVGMIIACASCTFYSSESVTRNGKTKRSVSGLAPDLASVRKERRKGVPAEAEWNRLGIWQRVAGDPPTYIPTGYPANAPRTREEGDWFVDERDGKKVFVPLEPCGDYSPPILRGEAKKITNWEFTKEGAWRDNAGWTQD